MKFSCYLFSKGPPKVAPPQRGPSRGQGLGSLKPQETCKLAPRGFGNIYPRRQLLVKQKVEGLEAFTGYETNNKYEIVNSLGQRIFYAVEGTKVTVEAPAGHVIGYVSQAWSICKPRYKIQTANEETVLRVKGPCCTWNLCGDIEFDITTADETSFCGRITKQWSGLAKEAFTDADNYGISFPIDLDVNVKAVLVGAVFLIDFMYFENNVKKDKTKVKN
ncbi:phospholipid scramblase 1-like [Ruditapes philippinarum]|uniref:phospholipid scramblase 1-like n=1 Tax=Ruditapes philippinarum TaxID=129788 RepID=UPI00295B7B15|nr:phospholipid scramblase 1-like [Ruditapes philippinarum]